MASTIAGGLTRSRFFALPPNLRVAAYTRTFASSTPRRSLSMDTVVREVTNLTSLGNNLLLDTIHSSGMAWSVAIPVSALIVRGIFLHSVAKKAHEKSRIRAAASPLFAARQNYILDYWISQTGFDGKQPGLSLPRTVYLNIRSFWDTSNRLKISPWPSHSLINLGLLIYFAEAIRIKCGSPGGLFTSVFSAVHTFLGWWADMLLVEASLKEREPTSTAGPPGESTNSSALGVNEQVIGNPVQSGATVPVFDDPTMHTEGLPWITDLTLADPTLILPVLLSATTIVPVLLEARRNGPQVTVSEPTSAAMESKGSWFALSTPQRFRIALGFLWGFLTMNWPSGVVLYILSSMSVGMLQRFWFNKTMPIPSRINTCKRPRREKIVAKWVE